MNIVRARKPGSDLVTDERLALPVMNVKLHIIDVHDIAGAFGP